MSKTVTVFEDRLSEVDLSEIQKAELLRFEPLWGSQNFIIRADDKVLLKHYVGFVSTPSLQLQILPKIYQDGLSVGLGNLEVTEAIEVLFRLLQFSGFMSVKDIPDAQQISQHQSDLLEIFIAIFVDRFLDMFSRHVHRQYEQQVENMTFIKGKILFQETILGNFGTRHKHFVQYEEFTEDNLLNQIFKSVMLSLRRTTRNAQNKAKITIALTYLEAVRSVELASHMFKQVRFTRLNEAYRPLFNMAKMFYHNYQPGLASGDQNTFTFLVPLNQLFEYTLFKLIDFGLGQTSLTVDYQKPQKHLDTENTLLLRPDITIRSGSDYCGIVDAKYKNPIVNGTVSLSQSDIYQMLAYAVKYHCDRVYLVYPKFKGQSITDNPLASYHIQDQERTIILEAVSMDLDIVDATKSARDLVQSLGLVPKKGEIDFERNFSHW